MAMYDAKEDKIYGCKKYSMIWWHERGHQALNKNPLIKDFEVYGFWFLICILIFLSQEQKKMEKVKHA